MEPIDLAAKGAAAAGGFLLEAYKSAGIAYDYIKSPVSAEVHNCWGRECTVQIIDKRLAVGSTYVWPFQKWKDSECYIRAEVDGCNVFGARVRPSSSSRKSWWSTRRWKVVVNSALVSKIPADSSGCLACCDAASCIEFDLYWETSDPFGSGASGNAWIRVCGDGEPELLVEWRPKMEQHRRSTLVDPSSGAFVGSGHSAAVAFLVFLTVEILMSQLFFAGEWWGVKSVSLSLLLALVPSALLTILFLVLINWVVDRHQGDRTISQRGIERAAHPSEGGMSDHVYFYDEGGPTSRNTARSGE